MTTMMLNLDGKPLAKWFACVKAGQKLSVSDECTLVYIFETPIADYRNLRDDLDARKNQTTKLGQIPTMIVNGELDGVIILKPNCYYEVLFFNYAGEVVDGGRISTGKTAVPHDWSLDNAKLFAVLGLNHTPDRARNVEVKIIPMTGRGASGTYAKAGFRFDDNEWDHTVWVDGLGLLGLVSYSHGYKVSDFQQFFK